MTTTRADGERVLAEARRLATTPEMGLTLGDAESPPERVEVPTALVKLVAIDEAEVAVYGAERVVAMFFLARGNDRDALLRGGEGLALATARVAPGAKILDPLTGETFTPDAWHEARFVRGWRDGRLAAMPHAGLVRDIDDADGSSLTTVGLQKFLVPDLRVSDVAPGLHDAMIVVLAIIAQALTDGAMPDASGVLTIDAGAMSWLALGEGPLPRAPLTVRLAHAASQTGPNLVLELVIEGPRAARRREQAALATKLGMSEPLEPAQISPDHPRLAPIAEEARRVLPDLRKRFEIGFGDERVLLIKAVFEAADAREAMWLIVKRFEGERIVGMLVSEPEVLRLRPGSELPVERSALRDYVIMSSSGQVLEGGKSDAVMRELTGGR